VEAAKNAIVAALLLTAVTCVVDLVEGQSFSVCSLGGSFRFKVGKEMTDLGLRVKGKLGSHALLN